METIVLNDFGQYLGTREESFIVYEDEEPIKEVLFEKLDQVVLTPGNNISTDALFWCSTYGIDVVMTSNTGRNLSMMNPIAHNKNVETRMKQYEAYENEKGIEVAKSILRTKIQNQKALLDKLGLESEKLNVFNELARVEGEKIDDVRRKLVYGIEGKCSRIYNKKLIKQFPEFLQVDKREKHKAEQSLNNIFNLAYEVLKAEVYRGVIQANLDPFLGYLHSIQYSKPSLVCDLQEPFRPMIDEFLINRSQDLNEKDFEKNGERMFLKEEKGYELIQSMNELLDTKVEHQRITDFGEKTKIRTIIREEAIKLGQFLREEKSDYDFLPLISKYSFSMRRGS